MTLQRFLEGMAEGRWSWAVRRAGVDMKPDRALPWSATAVQVLVTTVYGCLAGLAVRFAAAAAAGYGGWWWAIQIFGGLGLSLGLVSQAMVIVAWNRRATALRRAGLATPPPRPKRRWWQTWVVAPVYVVVCLGLTPGALWIAVDNAVGEMAWNRSWKELKARGEPVTLKDLLPAMPPDEQNFWRTPLLKSANEYSLVESNGFTEIVWADPAGRHRADAMWLPDPVSREKPEKKTRGARTNSLRMDLDSYARGIRSQPVRKFQEDQPSQQELGVYGLEASTRRDPRELPAEVMQRFGLVRTNVPKMNVELARALVIEDPAREVLEFLKRYEPELSEIAAAAERPFSAYPVNWDAGFGLHLSHLSFAKKLSTMFRLRASARLASGDATGGFADAVTALRIAERSAPEPVLISLLVRIAQTAIATSALAEGWAERKWTDAQWKQLQEMVLARDMQAEGVRGFQGERVFANLQFEQMLMLMAPGRTRAGAGGPGLLSVLSPRGFVRRNMVAQSRAMDVLLARLREPDWTVNVEGKFSIDRLMEASGLKPITLYNVLPSMLLPALDKSVWKLARQATMLRLAGVACALERHRLKHGAYPETLAGLAPEFLGDVPRDPMSGQALLYERPAPDSCRLWSVGLNGRDDGGVTLAERNDENGDWVWAYTQLR